MYCNKHQVDIPEGGKCTGPGGVMNLNCGGCDKPTGQFTTQTVDGHESKIALPCLRKWKHEGACNPYGEYAPVLTMPDNPVHIERVREQKLF